VLPPLVLRVVAVHQTWVVGVVIAQSLLRIFLLGLLVAERTPSPPLFVVAQPPSLQSDEHVKSFLVWVSPLSLGLASQAHPKIVRM